MVRLSMGDARCRARTFQTVLAFFFLTSAVTHAGEHTPAPQPYYRPSLASREKSTIIAQAGSFSSNHGQARRDESLQTLVVGLREMAQDDEDEVRPVAKPTPRTQAANTVVPPARASAEAGTSMKEPADPNEYIIGEQDELMVTVWKEKELSGSVVVRPDGKITVPLVGEVKVIGITPVHLETLLEQKLKPYIAVPQVTVAVSQINSRRVYLIGQVVKEGGYQINSSTTVLQLIAQAGGLRDFAKRKNIYILRQQGSEQTRFSFNYEAVVRGRNKDQNILLQPGDTIVVP